MILFFLVGLPVISANITHDSHDTHWALAPFSLISQGIQRSYFTLSSGVRGTTRTYLNLVGIKKKNRLLEEKNDELRAQLGALTELKLENQRLNSLLDFQKNSNMDLLAAKVIASGTLPDHSALVIDKGYEHGIQKNMAAITPGGVVGYVIESLPKTSKILLITDRYMVVDALIQRSRSRGILEGYSKHLGHLSHIDSSTDVLIGDLIVTSGLQKVFPKGFPVGQVISVKDGPQKINKEILVKPAIDPYKTEELFIILNPQNESFEPKPDEMETALPLTDAQPNNSESDSPSSGESSPLKDNLNQESSPKQ